ncbi:FAD-dependent monooxygenase [Egicoccus halophilus]|uniref:FAD-dependent oxidoreductase n=1 Tax=Egicoccus halophilus TaxID=1670830 RepID=A0A8J3ABK2_9ACTN|nr:FAD-dependent monooxygenase [Egicoccus halophilus]GGI07532.1 FAD-dependent oxidoreductase [Egicoccus halophilus]
MGNHDHEVIIVGGGPVGVGLAIALGQRGVDCVVLEQRTELSPIPKGQGLAQRTMEHFHFFGVEPEIRAARTMPRGHPIGQITAYGSLMSDFWHAPAGREVVRSYYFQANERLPQYRTEAVLRRRLDELTNVTLHLGAVATEVTQSDDGARVEVEIDGERRWLSARYVVGCDGGRSMVREHADITRHGTDWGELVSLIVFRSRDLHEALERFPARSTYRVMHPALQGYWQFFGRVDVGESFFFHAPIPHGTDLEHFDALAQLREAAGFDLDATIDHVGFWDLRVQVADRYRRGNVFIAGDAAHTHPPYGGYGLNNGMEDAVNLAWKLTAALRGWGGEQLLDSYTEERQAIFSDIGERLIGGWIEHDREWLATYAPETHPDFQERFADFADSFGRKVSTFEPHYEGSSVIVGAPEGGVSSALGEHTYRARPGHHLPPLRLADDRNVFEALGAGFALIAVGAADADLETFEEAARATGTPLHIVRDPAGGETQQFDAGLVLVRPDQYIAWTGDTVPADPGALLARVTGRGAITTGATA